MKKKNVGIVGGSGYAGEELLSLVSNHQFMNLQAVSSRDFEGQQVSSVFESFSDLDLIFSRPTDDKFFECDVVYFCTPHGISMQMAKQFLDNETKIIDLSADFRLKDKTIWEKWYGMKHRQSDLIEESIYGLVDIYGEDIKKANLIAVPGCYPTASLLGLMPLLNQEINISNIVIDAKSGLSGAGRSTVEGGMQKEMHENLRAYAALGHRHLPEIKQEAERASGQEINISFMPHLIPMMRGIYASIYIQTDSSKLTKDIFDEFYTDSPSVVILDDIPKISDVVNTNKCEISLFDTPVSGQYLVISAIDNLLKGASGQAVQCFNLMFGLDLDESF
tara:strand:+ start:2271 stop:3272 length:1002 start_codon:yes stop_codon:yes gene_type:complete